MEIWKILAGLIALEHVGFFVLESFLWQRPTGLKIFGNTPENAALMAPLAVNQGLYNGFLAAGLIWAIAAPPTLARPLAYFFFGCVLVAGLVGGATAKPSIWGLQALPAAIALAVLALS